MEKFNINIVVGTGFSGATMARLIAEVQNEPVIVYEQRPHIAGNAYDYKDDNRITVHHYGSHIFHTDNKDVFDFLSRFGSFNHYKHSVHGVINGKETYIPFNLNTLRDLFPPKESQNLRCKLLTSYAYGSKIPILEFQKSEDQDFQKLASFIYKKIFKGYSQKQWGTSFSQLDKSVTDRVPVYISEDNKYFQDAYQGIPLAGYTQLIANMLDHPLIDLRLNAKFTKSMLTSNMRVFYTGPIDDFFEMEFGPLPYRSLNFEFETIGRPFFQNSSVVNYPETEAFTRIHEFKYYLSESSEKSTICREYPQDFVPGENEPYYPLFTKDAKDLYLRYVECAKQYPNVFFLGRLAEYKYYDMDDAVIRALALFKEVFYA